MSSAPPPSAPHGVPSSGGNGKYIAVALFLLLGMGGIAFWKFGGGTTPTPQPSVTSSVPTSSVPTAHLDDVPPPPPTEDAGPDTGVKVVTNYGPGPNPCEVKTCNGSPTPDMEGGLAMLARQTRRKCYEPALGQDPTLSGKVTVNIKIASNGQICGANVTSNNMSIPSVGDCAARMIASSGHVPSPKGGCVNIDVPLNYVAAGNH